MESLAKMQAKDDFAAGSPKFDPDGDLLRSLCKPQILCYKYKIYGKIFVNLGSGFFYDISL